MGQDDIKLLMPESKRLHQFCAEECVSSDMYGDSNLTGQKSDKNSVSENNESSMASADDDLVSCHQKLINLSCSDLTPR